jgi:hypothetical protein
MAFDPLLRAHQEWLGLIQPIGLVVSAPALVRAQVPTKLEPGKQQTLLGLLGPEGETPVLSDLPRLCRELLRWEAKDLAGAVGGPTLPETLTVALPEYNDHLRPTYAVPDATQPGGWLLLILELPVGTDPDTIPPGEGRGWHATPQARFERLLRETGVPMGLLSNGHLIRLVFAPRGESSGCLTFPIGPMTSVAGRPLLAALDALLSAERLFVVPTPQRLPALLRESRKYQNEVSTRLAEQVLEALYELVRGFQAADDLVQGALMNDVLREAPADAYGGFLTTLLRLVFTLYAEDRGLVPVEEVYLRYYSVTGLYERLREDAALHADLMDQRYGAWAQLLTLFRLLHDGGSHAGLHLPARHGKLFDPDAYPFLEGRPHRTHRVLGDRITPPKVSDGTIYRVLKRLLVLDGDRLSYRALDVEQIGSVYEAVMGFELITTKGVSIAVRPKTKKPGSSSHPAVNLDALLASPPKDRSKRLKDEADCDLIGQSLERLQSAATVDDLVAALGKKVSRFTPRPLPRGAMVLQPTEERRRSGSHYTPRQLTEPIVRTALRPVLQGLGENPRPEQILDLKICDPAMGSGAFLVETCRFLGDMLVEAWQRHNVLPVIPPHEDVQLYARRVVAQRCLYGVDRNPFAVDLAKLSLWLVTLAKDHPFTFLDHVLRCGDSLVGFSRKEIARFHWEDKKKQLPLFANRIEERVKEVERLREELEKLADRDDTGEKGRLLKDADDALADVRLIGDALVVALSSSGKPKPREQARATYAAMVADWLGGAKSRSLVEELGESLRVYPHPLPPFHWEAEFPETFLRSNPGFDAFVGNPPFAGKNSIINGNRDNYLPFLQTIHEEAHGNADLVAHFFRRAFNLLRSGGSFGLIATNTIAQGDTRSTGLRWMCKHGCTIYEAKKRIKWPGLAAVVVSVVHGKKGEVPPPYQLDGREVDRITAFLFHDGGHDDPIRLKANEGKSFQGSIVLGMGFTFDDNNPGATPLAEMHRLVAKDPRNAERIFAYIGGEEVNDTPTHVYHRFVIDFGAMTEEEARRWPDLLQIVRTRVKPDRDVQKRDALRERWWQYAEKRPGLYSAVRSLERVLVINCGATPHMSFAFLSSRLVFANTLAIICDETPRGLAVLQSRIHESWARLLGSSMKDDLRYTPTDCYETFPFPTDWVANASLEEAGRVYHEFRTAVMVSNQEGLTKTYNRFHDPDERSHDILRLRDLHDSLDRAVLDAYGWTDIIPVCEFITDYDDDEDADDPPRGKRKPWRYRWPEDMRDEVLARLLELNRERARAEGQAVPPAPTPAAKREKLRTPASAGQGDLLGSDET